MTQLPVPFEGRELTSRRALASAIASKSRVWAFNSFVVGWPLRLRLASVRL